MKMTDEVTFVDANYPGVVYRGSRAHMEGLAYEGGSPFEVSVPYQEPGEDGELIEWPVRQAPAHWAGLSSVPLRDAPDDPTSRW